MVTRYNVDIAMFSDPPYVVEDECEHGRWVEYTDHEAAIKAKDEAYNALLDQTIQFAEMAQSDMITEGSMKQAKAFLARPEVQARRKEQG